MADASTWWMLAGAAVVVELVTGTFYLLMLGIGMAAGALAALAGLGQSGQLLAAAFVGGGAVITWHFVHKRRFAQPSDANTNMNLDAGETVQVDAWAEDNTAAVRYRGTVWTAVPAGGTPQGTGLHKVRELSGSRLVLEKV